MTLRALEELQRDDMEIVLINSPGRHRDFCASL
jgi:hypothetical protein